MSDMIVQGKSVPESSIYVEFDPADQFIYASERFYDFILATINKTLGPSLSFSK
jgi:hypothetical protein